MLPPRAASLSLCMIVKDEADMLPGFLQSVQGLWDQLVVVDTGSTDNSVALLQAAGAQVLHQPWRHDFAWARNHSLDAASGDWIIFLDPDEYVSSEFVAQARALLDDAGIGAATVAMQNVREDGHVQEAHLLRMFRRAPGVRFRHAIHEDVGETLLPHLRASGQRAVHLTAPIIHHGYSKALALARNKKQRDTAIIAASLRQNPDDLYLHFKLLEQARFWADPELARSAAPLALQAWHRVPDSGLNYWAGELAVMLVDGLYPGQWEPALQQLQALGARVPDSPAIAHRCGELLELLARLDEAQAAFERALTLPGPAINTQLGNVRPRMGLVRIAIAKHDLEAARAHLQQAHQLAPQDPEVVFTQALL